MGQLLYLYMTLYVRHSQTQYYSVFAIPLQHHRYSNTRTFLEPLDDVMSLVAIDTVNGLALEHIRVSTYCILKRELGQILRGHPKDGENTHQSIHCYASSIHTCSLGFIQNSLKMGMNV